MVTLKGFPTGTLTFLIFDPALYYLKINWNKCTIVEVEQGRHPKNTDKDSFLFKNQYFLIKNEHFYADLKSYFLAQF